MVCTWSAHHQPLLGSATNIVLTLLLFSNSVAAAQEPILISSHSAAPPAESAEVRVKLRQHREASALNRFTFVGNVLKGTGDVVEHWIAMFCSGWHEKCQSLLPSYELLGVQWEDKLNTALMSSKVRFVKVDCATEKALCVSLDIHDYPSVVHYRHGQRVNGWFGGAPGLVRWIKEELQPPKRRAAQKARAIASERHHPVEQSLNNAKDQVDRDAEQSSSTTCKAKVAAAETLRTGSFRGWHWQLVRSLCFLFMFASVAHYAWAWIASARARNDKTAAHHVDRSVWL